MKLSDIGEYRLVERIQSHVDTKGRRNSSVVVGPGDDAFVAQLPPGYLLTATKDLLVEGVHFKKEWYTPQQLGYKAMAVNISDLAAMGASTPLYALVGVALPGFTSVDFITRFSHGMKKMAAQYGVRILGGDTTASARKIFISITLIGAIKKKNMVLRSTAQAGDLIFVTGTCGDSAGGLELLKQNLKKKDPWQSYLIKKHIAPEPHVKEAKLLAERNIATSLIDSSDGLGASVTLITRASNVGAILYLDKIPLSPALKRLLQNRNPWGLVLNGGEDYELVFTVKPKQVPALRKVLPHAVYVGEITPRKGVRYYSQGKPLHEQYTGFQHFR